MWIWLPVPLLPPPLAYLHSIAAREIPVVVAAGQQHMLHVGIHVRLVALEPQHLCGREAGHLVVSGG